MLPVNLKEDLMANNSIKVVFPDDIDLQGIPDEIMITCEHLQGGILPLLEAQCEHVSHQVHDMSQSSQSLQE